MEIIISACELEFVCHVSGVLGGEACDQPKETVRNEETKTFTGRVELARNFKATPRVIEAEIGYTVENGQPKFLTIEAEGRRLPIREVSESSLLQAYLHRRPSSC